MLKIIHAADLHLDSPFSGLTPERAARRRAEQRELLDRLAALARERGADLVLLAGDLLDSERVARETAQALGRALEAMGCPVFIAPGNHDFYSPRSVYASLTWPDNVHIFTAPEIARVDLPERSCAVYGRAFDSAHLESGPLAGFHARREGGETLLMCLHGDVTVQGGPYGPIAPLDIAASGLDYLALGHIHRASGLRREGDTFWAYPGCPEGRGFGEQGEKGCLWVEAEPGNVTARFVPLGRRRYEILDVDITGADSPLSAVLAALPEGTGNDIYRIYLAGEGAAPDLEALERALEGKFYGLTLYDRTRLPFDLWERRGEDSLTGLFLRTMWQLYQRDPEDRTVQLAARFGLAALENGEDPAL